MTVRTKNSAVTQSVMASSCALMLLGILVDSSKITFMIGQTLFWTGMLHSYIGTVAEIDESDRSDVLHRFGYWLLGLLFSGVAVYLFYDFCRGHFLSRSQSLVILGLAAVLHVAIAKIAAYYWGKGKLS